MEKYENHKYENEFTESLAMKVFVYEFAIKFINPIFYLFFFENFKIFSTNLVATVIADDLIEWFEKVVTEDITYEIKLRKLMRSFAKTRQEKVTQLVEEMRDK